MNITGLLTVFMNHAGAFGQIGGPVPRPDGQKKAPLMPATPPMEARTMRAIFIPIGICEAATSPQSMRPDPAKLGQSVVIRIRADDHRAAGIESMGRMK